MVQCSVSMCEVYNSNKKTKCDILKYIGTYLNIPYSKTEFKEKANNKSFTQAVNSSKNAHTIVENIFR